MSEGIQTPTCSNCTVREKTGFCFEEGTACINHTNAREYLIQDVIKELERKRDRRAEFIYDSSTNPMVAAYNEAIALIRDGVKHE